MYGQRLKVTESVKFLGVSTDNHLSMKQHMEHIEKASLINRMRNTKLNIIHVTLLIRLYKTVTRPYMDYAGTSLTVLNKILIQNGCLRYGAVDSTCISNNELRFRCNIVSLE